MAVSVNFERKEPEVGLERNNISAALQKRQAQHPPHGALTSFERVSLQGLGITSLTKPAALKGLTMNISRLTAPTLAAILSITACAPAHAANCAARQAVVDRLANSYGETVQSIGLGSNNRIVEVYASSQTGTWTITVTMPNGMTCLVASGQAFEEINTPNGAPA